jgi:hypothetical protein
VCVCCACVLCVCTIWYVRGTHTVVLSIVFDFPSIVGRQLGPPKARLVDSTDMDGPLDAAFAWCCWSSSVTP